MAVKRIGFNDNFVGSAMSQKRYGAPDPWQYAQNSAAKRQYGAPDPWQVANNLARPTVKLPTPPAAPSGPAPARGGPEGPNPNPPQQKKITLDDPEIAGDPLVLKIKKLATGQRDDARSTAIARKKALAIETGSDVLAREFGLDDTTAQAARENPLSALATIRDDGRREEQAFNEDANKANLFFGGYRGRQLGELAKALLTAEAQAQAQARQRFGGIEGELLGTLGDADQMEMDAEIAAYERAVDRAAKGLGGILDTTAADSAGIVDDPLNQFTPAPDVSFAMPQLGAGFTASNSADRRRRGLLEELLF